jgi:hypothetical protein
MSRIMEMENTHIYFSGKPKGQDGLSDIHVEEDNRFVIVTSLCSE